MLWKAEAFASAEYSQMQRQNGCYIFFLHAFLCVSGIPKAHRGHSLHATLKLHLNIPAKRFKNHQQSGVWKCCSEREQKVTQSAHAFTHPANLPQPLCAAAGVEFQQLSVIAIKCVFTFLPFFFLHKKIATYRVNVFVC